MFLQPALAILFGRLALNFVSFGTTVKLYQSGQASIDQLHAAAQDFQSSANKNAVLLVYAGTFIPFP
jgi:ATP-binding cassette subfamily B (MDR/TAP) protein 1